MIIQLSPTILVETLLGRGHAIFIIDYGMHQNSCWVVGSGFGTQRRREAF